MLLGHLLTFRISSKSTMLSEGRVLEEVLFTQWGAGVGKDTSLPETPERLPDKTILWSGLIQPL